MDTSTMPRDLLENEVEFFITLLPEDESPESFFEDPETIEWIHKELDNGNEMAWTTIVVTAKWNEFSGSDYLGASSYTSMQDFKSCSYFTDMKTEALSRLNETVKAHHEEILKLTNPLE